jgi:(p)ppGpp synthase/HD superfamily hydrolase
MLSAGRGIVIHRESCSNITGLKKHPDKYIFVQWAEYVEGEFQVELKIDVLNKRGVLAVIANALSDCEANIDNVNVEEKDSQYTALLFLIRIKGRKHLARILRRIRSIHVVTRVQRLK